MAISKQQTTIAVLRDILGPIHGQEENFAKLASKSVSWVKKVSAGIKPLSEEAAIVLNAEIGISAEWLLNRDPEAPAKADCPSGMLSPDSEYTYEVFEAHRADLEVGARAARTRKRENTTAQIAARHRYQSSKFWDLLEQQDVELVEQCEKVLTGTRDHKLSRVIRWRLKDFLDKLAVEFVVNPKPRPSKVISRKRLQGVVKRQS